MTLGGTLAGTPEYMSPEQIRDPDRLTQASDVCGLGVMHYEALTGETPFRGAPHMVLQQVLSDDPVTPRRLNDAVPRDLETICLKAMAKEPHRRYLSAGDTRDDLRRWLSGEPIEARPMRTSEKLWHWCRRKPLVAGLSAALVLVFALGFAGVAWQWQEARNHLQGVDRERDRAKENFQLALDAVERFHTQVSEERLLQEPGMQPLRKELLETARKFYTGFVEKYGRPRNCVESKRSRGTRSIHLERDFVGCHLTGPHALDFDKVVRNSSRTSAAGVAGELVGEADYHPVLTGLGRI
jgi:hypothetical protein